MSDMIQLQDPELALLLGNKQDGFKYKERRLAEMTENYTLYRDKVIINRLTQRQSVNVPLMKMIIRTILKDIDDMPVLYFENLDNDKQAELFKNEYWQYTVEENRLDLQDIIDKKQVLLFGRSFDQWQIVDGKVKMTVIDPFDILVSRYTDPVDINTSRFLIHTHIFKTISSLEENPDYDQTEVKKLKEFYATDAGLVKANDNMNMLQKKNEKLSQMGMDDIESPILGETYVEITLHFFHKTIDGKDKIHLYVECDDMVILMKKTLEEVIGKTKDNYWHDHYPYVSWGDDLEKQDFWNDGVGDICRTPNKILNSDVSAMVENRTLRNLGMRFYDATKTSETGFAPNTYQPRTFGFYGVPGKPSDILMNVDIPDLSDSIDEMTYIQTMVEKTTGATSTQQGVQTENKITLGEVELALGEAKERVKGISKFYTPAWKQRGIIFDKLCEAGTDKLDAITAYKKGRNTKDIYSREITPDSWQTKSGYRTKVWSMDEKKSQDTVTLQKLNAAKSFMINNAKLDDIYKRKLLEFSDLKPDEVNEVMRIEEENQAAIAAQNQMAMAANAGQPAGQQPGQPMNTQPKLLNSPTQ
jgi:hypothetical protein